MFKRNSLYLFALLSFLMAFQVHAFGKGDICFSKEKAPYGLLIDLGGGEADAEVSSVHPRLSWIVPLRNQGTMQSAYQLELCDGRGKRLWRSEKIGDSRSVAVEMGGPELRPGNRYSWRVRCWDDKGKVSKWSEYQSFATSDILDGSPLHRRLVTEEQSPVATVISPERLFADFGKAAFARIKVHIKSNAASMTVRLGEACEGTSVNRNPGGSIRYCAYEIPLEAGKEDYLIEFSPDPRNTDKTGKHNASGVLPVYMPDYTGEVYPFRYCEVEVADFEELSLTRLAVHYPFDEGASHFDSADSVLNQVWDLCKYSVKATSFCGIYVDGDRERIAYEADALINQLCHYNVDREYSMARKSVDYLIDNPTWPTEWCLQTLIMAWNDYMYTGDDSLLRRRYDVLKAKTLLALVDESGLISTRTGKLTKEVMRSTNYKGQFMRDIVDWPQAGMAGVEKERPGEADGYVFTDHNTVVNAFHYEAVKLLAQIARVLGRDEEAAEYQAYCAEFYERFNSLLLGSEGIYKDGLETDHSSLHANMMAYAFGLVPEENRAAVMEYIKSRRMACSVYGAQFLLDALYLGGEGEYARSLMNSTGERSWYNMIRSGSTVTLEAWDAKYKPNLDWNHAWGAVPAGAIPRGLIGVRPLEAGFSRAEIRLQPGGLEHFDAKVPTIRGAISISLHSGSSNSGSLDSGSSNSGSMDSGSSNSGSLHSGSLTIRIPANMTVDLILPDGTSHELCPGLHTLTDISSLNPHGMASQK